MEVFNRSTARNTGPLKTLRSYLLISPANSAARALSLQVSEIPVGSHQPIHQHPPEQCYYIVRGRGLMTIEEQERHVVAGDAVLIPSGLSHGIRNVGDEVLEYLTANAPAFGKEYEERLWPADPEGAVEK